MTADERACKVLKDMGDAKAELPYTLKRDMIAAQISAAVAEAVAADRERAVADFRAVSARLDQLPLAEWQGAFEAAIRGQPPAPPPA